MPLKYMVLITVGVIFMGLLVAGELYFESPASRTQQYTIAQRTLGAVGTQMSEMDTLQQTVEASEPMQTQYAVAMSQQNALVATQTAIIEASPLPENTNIQASETPPPAVQATEISQETHANVTNVATSTGIDANGCASNTMTIFNTVDVVNPSPIYFVAETQNVIAGSDFQTRWYSVENTRDIYTSGTWTADADYPQTCIYFWIEPSDITYQSGSWMIEFVENGVVIQTATFIMCRPEDGCTQSDN